MEGRADVVHDAGFEELCAPRPAADLVGSLEDRDVETCLREAHRACESVGSAADDDRCSHPDTVTGRRGAGPCMPNPVGQRILKMTIRWTTKLITVAVPWAMTKAIAE